MKTVKFGIAVMLVSCLVMFLCADVRVLAYGGYGVQYDFAPVRTVPFGEAVEDYIMLTKDSAEYEIRPGDTLWGISEKFLGNGLCYEEVFAANKGVLSDADLIRPGQRIEIPERIYIPRDRYDRGGHVYEGAFHIALPDMVDNQYFLDVDLYDVTHGDAISIFSNPVTNRMGENALTENWDDFVAEVKRCAKNCGGRVSNLVFEKYQVENGCDLCGYSFDFDAGECVELAVFYCLGTQNMAEVIGMREKGNDSRMVDVTRYTAASFEDFGGRTGMGFTKMTENIGAGDWNYPELHNLFTALMTNFIDYAKRPEQNAPGDYELSWENALFEEAVRNALTELWQLDEAEKREFGERALRKSDTDVITDMRCVLYPEGYSDDDTSGIPELALSFNGHTELIALPEGEVFPCHDLTNFMRVRTLAVRADGLDDYSFLAAMPDLRTLSLYAGETLQNLDFLAPLSELRTLFLKEYDTYREEGEEAAFSKIRSLAVLKNCPHLEYLHLETPHVTDFSFLESCPEICTMILYPEICMSEECSRVHADEYSHNTDAKKPETPDVNLLPNARFLEFYGESVRWEP